jgi:chromosome segregation ATPase
VIEILDRLDALETGGGNGAGSDTHMPELLSRLEALEQSGPQPSFEVDALSDRIATLENQRLSASADDGMTAALRARQQELEERLNQIAQEVASPKPAAGGMTEEERNRLMQWSRETQEQIEELKEQVVQLREFGAGGESSGAVTLGAIQTLGDRIAESLGRSSGGGDMKQIKNQMYFVYFTIGMIYAVGGFAGLLYLLR